MEKTLERHQYASLERRGRGLVRRYLARMTGFSRAQMTRLINALVVTPKAARATNNVGARTACRSTRHRSTKRRKVCVMDGLRAQFLECCEPL